MSSQLICITSLDAMQSTSDTRECSLTRKIKTTMISSISGLKRSLNFFNVGKETWINFSFLRVLKGFGALGMGFER